MGISIAQFYDEVKIIPPTKPILIIGDTGIGKTTIVKYLAEQVLKMDFAYIACSSNGEIVNLTGIPDITGDCTDYKPPKWYKPNVDQVVMLDEINRNETIISALMELAVDKHLGSIQLTQNSRIFAAMNPSFKSTYKVFELDSANMTRFVIVELEPTPEEWLMFAEKEGIHSSIIKFIQHNKADLDSLTNEDNISKSKGRQYHGMLPTRRGWYTLSEALYNAEQFSNNDGKIVNRVSKMHYDDAKDFLLHLVCGYVGIGAGQRFTEFYFGNGCVLTPIDILEGSDEDWKKLLPDTIYEMCMNNGTSATELADAVCNYLASIEDKLYNNLGTGPSTLAKQYAINFYKYLYSCTSEYQKYIYKMGIKKVQKTNNKWPNLLCIACSNINSLLLDIANNTVSRK